MASAVPSVVPKPFVCSICATSSETSQGWLFRKERLSRGRTVEHAYCPSCGLKAHQDIEQEAQDASVAGGVLIGALAALVGAGAWYGLVLATDKKYAFAAIGMGWLVGRGVLLGAGNKRSGALQVVGGVLAAVGIVGGEYLTMTHLGGKYVEGFSGWLTPGQFAAVYREVLKQGNWVLDIAFYFAAVFVGAVQPRPLKLVPRK